MFCTIKLITKYSALLSLAVVLFTSSNFANAQTSTLTAGSNERISGTATASNGAQITEVDLSIRTGSQYWDGNSFVSNWTRVLATVNGNNWSYDFSTPLSVSTFFVSVRAIDSNGSIQSPMTYSSVMSDGTNPTALITSSNNPNVINGTASDSGGSGLDRVELSIRSSAGQFWNGSAFTSSYARVETSLNNGNWTYTINPSLPNGTYYASVFPFDEAGNFEISAQSISFIVGEDARPDTIISSTYNDRIAGLAIDDSGIAAVELAISDGNSYWNGNSFTSYSRVAANIDGEGGSVGWDYDFPANSSLPPGEYSVTAIAFDDAGNPQAAPYTTTAITCY